MQNWLNFWIFLFWFSFLSFFLNYFNFLLILLFSEFLWLVLYCISIYIACKNDDIVSLSLTFIFLGLAGLEFSLGLLVIVLFKNLNYSLNFFNNNNLNELDTSFLIKNKNYYFFQNNFI